MFLYLRFARRLRRASAVVLPDEQPAPVQPFSYDLKKVELVPDADPLKAAPTRERHDRKKQFHVSLARNELCHSVRQYKYNYFEVLLCVEIYTRTILTFPWPEE